MKQSANTAIALVLLAAMFCGAALFATPGSYALVLTGMLFWAAYRAKPALLRLAKIQHNGQHNGQHHFQQTQRND